MKMILLLLTVLLFCVSGAAAAETLVFDLGKVVVGDEPRPGLSAGSSAGVCAADIEVRHARSVDQALHFIPGVRISTGQKNEPLASIRGFTQDKVLVLLDGIPLAGPNYGYVDLDQIPTENISRIIIEKGAVSPLYGANTLGGAINIVSKQPPAEPVVSAQAGAGAHNTRDFAVNYGARPGDFLIWCAAARRVCDGFALSRDFAAKRNQSGRLRQNSDYEKNSLSLKAGYEPAQEHNLTAFVHIIDNEKGIPPDVSADAPRYWRFTQWRRRMAALAAQSQLNDRVSLRGRVYYDKYDNILAAYDDAAYAAQNKSSSFTSTFDEYAAGGSLYAHYDAPGDKRRLSAALNFRNDVHKEQNDPGREWLRYTVRTYSLAGEDNFSVSEDLSMLWGASVDFFEQVKAAGTDTGDTISAVNPMAGLKYSLSEKVRLSSSLAQRTNFPTIQQLYSRVSGNPGLNEQRNIAAELTGQWELNRDLIFETAVFHNEVNDLIARAGRDDPYLNIDRAVISGLEAAVKAGFGGKIFSRLGYTAINARDKNPEFLGRNNAKLPYTPKHKADFEFGGRADFGLTAVLLGAYHGKRHYYDRTNSLRELGGYTVWNLNLRQEISRHWTAGIFAENIFDRGYEEETGFPRPGRTILLTLKAAL